MGKEHQIICYQKNGAVCATDMNDTLKYLNCFQLFFLVEREKRPIVYAAIRLYHYQFNLLNIT